VKEETAMQVAKITRSGLAAMAGSVFLLWGCVAGERVVLRDAQRQYARALRDIRQLQRKQQTQPASAPVLRPPVPARPTAA
jgi:cytochrome b